MKKIILRTGFVLVAVFLIAFPFFTRTEIQTPEQPAAQANLDDQAILPDKSYKADAPIPNTTAIQPANSPASTYHRTKAFMCEMGPDMSKEEVEEELEIVLAENWRPLINAFAPPKKQEEILAGVIEQGDTISKILEEASEGRVHHYVDAMKKVFPPSGFRPGQPYTVVTDPDSGSLKRFEYEINDLRRLIIEGQDKPKARLEDIKYTTVLEAVACIIEDNLFQAVANAGEGPQLAVRVAEIFGSEINFVRNLQEGDNFTVLVEKRYRNGQYRGYGRIIAARFVNRGKMYEAFLYRDLAGKTNYYNGKGENLKKTLLQAPLAVTRLTSRFSHNRKHPILGTSRPHLGVDYGAPAGTPVKAVGDGVIIKQGWAGGYGNQVIIRHDSGLESQYAHLSRFGKNLRAGQSVRQGQVIGYVGSTGLSTGPHLDFRLKQNGQFVDPTKAINPRAASVNNRLLEHFTRTVAQERAYLEGHRLPRQYSVNSLVPIHVAQDMEKDGKRAEQSAKKMKTRPVKRKNIRLSSKKRS